ncbi:MAG: GNAT family N-acetyltransferase [Nocardioidaceae bacterium]
MGEEVGPAIAFQEHSDADLPDVLRAQVLSFLRIVWPEGFMGPLRFRDWTSEPDQDAYHLLYAADSVLVSHLEIITTTVCVGGERFGVQAPTAVMTYPAFRGEGWASRLVAEAASRIDRGAAEVGVLTCGRGLVEFFERSGWEPIPQTTIIAGPDGETWQSDDVLLMRSTGPRSSEFHTAVQNYPMRVADEW